MCKVSIIVPVYNVMDYLNRCIDSLINQTLSDIEIILVDDGSTDNSPQMCDNWSKLDQRIKVVHKKNAGLGFARNTGLGMSSGEYVAFVDSDDYVDYNAFEILYNTAKNSNADAVYSYSFVRVKNGIVNYPKITQKEDLVFEGNDTIKQIILRMFGSRTQKNNIPNLGFSVCKTLYKRKCIDDYSLRFVSEREYISEDAIFQIDFLCHANKIVRKPICYYYYCYNSSSLTHKYQKGRFDRDVLYCKEVRRKMYSISDNANVEQAFNLFLFERARDTMSYVVHNSKENVNQELLEICGNKDLRCSLASIPKQLLSFKELLFFICIKYKFVSLIKAYFSYSSWRTLN